MPLVRYRDLWFRIIACVFAAHFIVMFGVNESFFKVLVRGIYHIPFLSSFIIAFLLFCYVQYITMRLDRRLDWQEHLLWRIPMQLVFGLVFPGLFAFGMAAAYFTLRGYNILETSYLQFDYPVILLLILLLNTYYTGYYIVVRLKQANTMQPALLTAAENERKTFLVNRGAKNIPVPLEEIAYFFRERNNYLRTLQGDDYIVSQSLDEIETALSGLDFFRVNRQLLVSRNACKHYEALPYNKLELTTEPKYESQVVISQKRSRAFKDWVVK